MDTGNRISYILLLVGVFTVMSWNAIAQERPKVIQLSEMSIGDTIPAGLPMKAMINYSDSSAKFSDFRGKWLILDFWATHCQACINAMPEFYRLQQEFKDELNIVLVTNESPERVQGLLERSPVAKGTYFPFIVQDTILHQLFPHRFIPHEVWIDSEGVVRAITDGHTVTSQNIKGMLNGQITSLPEKKDHLDNAAIPDGSEDLILYKAQLSKIKDINSGSKHVRRDNLTGEVEYERLPKRFFVEGTGVINLLYTAYIGAVEDWISSNVNRKRIVFDIHDTSIYERFAKILIDENRVNPSPTAYPYLHWKNSKEYADDMRYDYDFQVPNGLPDSVFFKKVLEDLNRYFPIKGRIENRRTTAWVVHSKMSTIEKLVTKGGESRMILNHDSLGALNRPLRKFFAYCQGFVDTPPIVNETNFNKDMMVDIGLYLSDFPEYDARKGVIRNQPLDFKTFKRELNKYGMDVKEEEREVPILVIYDE